MSYEHILFTEADGIATLTINRPQVMNALHVGVIEEMIDAVDRVRDEGTARVLVMTGTGRAFCSGADLAGVAPVAAAAGLARSMPGRCWNRTSTRCWNGCLRCPCRSSPA